VEFHHYPSQNIYVLNTLRNRAIRIFDEEHLKHENYYMTKVLRIIGYINTNIKIAIRRAMERERSEP
jgi:hypothetical protein